MPALSAAIVGTSLVMTSFGAAPVLATSTPPAAVFSSHPASVTGLVTASNPSASSPSLARGARGDRVAALQRALISADVTVRGGADGIFGPATETALRTFQTSVGLQPTGTLDHLTAHLLSLGPAPDFPARGDRGNEVAHAQRALLDAGISLRGGADGIFGPATSDAVARFQQRANLDVSGRIDTRTAIALGLASQEQPTIPSDTSASSAPASDRVQAELVESATAPMTLPRRGDTSESVAVVQRALLAAGVTVRGGADGIFGSATENAVKFYQRNVRRPATGEVDEKTAQLLGLLPAPAIPRRGDRSDEVATVQRALLAAGVTLRGGADGIFGSATETAITTYQSRLGITASGRLDLVTFFSLLDGEKVGPTSPNADASSSSPSSSTSPSTSPSTSSSAEPTRASVFPVQGPCWFTDTWHAPRSGGRRHVGVDIIAPTGKAIYAVTDGMITRQWFDKPGSLGGNALRLTADDDTYFHYAHLSEFAPGIDLGSEVVAGQIIGYVGSTGNSSTPHLHFEYHPHGGSAVNPYAMVKSIDACKATELLPQPSGE
ncbi:MAG: peptidoglycan-binding protein [Actinobacteria bacterium]|nr:peptidoglycan-binding protein [Actinomycetota bacterium]